MDSSLIEELNRLSNPAPLELDPELQDSDQVTSAKVSEFVDETEDNEIRRSKLRGKTAAPLWEQSERYRGQKTTRKQITGSDNESEEEEEEESADEDESQEEESNDEDESQEEESNDEGEEENSADEDESADGDLGDFRDKMIKLKGQHSTRDLEESNDDDTDEEDDDGENSDEESDEDEDDSTSLSQTEDDKDIRDGPISTFSNMELQDDIEKGKAVKAQLGLWDSLLEIRIRIQKALIAINQLPHSSEQPETLSELKTAQEKANVLLNQLISVQTKLLRKTSPTKEDTDEEKKHTSDDDIEDAEPELKRKHDLETYSALISKRHKAFESHRNSTIQKWYDRTKLSSGKLRKSGPERTTLQQIQHILSDRERLIQRTQIKRQSQNPSERNPEIFDDTDFYQQLLRELIERRTSGVNDPVALGRQWLEIQKLRSKMKRKVDTKASKGRKLRYDVHAKLVNFMAPIVCEEIAEEAKDDLYRSLFGRKPMQS